MGYPDLCYLSVSIGESLFSNEEVPTQVGFQPRRHANLFVLLSVVILNHEAQTGHRWC